ncbi:TonB-dependent receptor [Novosphingobium sp.]|uniref:TonB-dependent receptor domain-containing protein n=1 Tax=Novosphingobium sp. TaxID=1874826 RepID=UPI002632C62F|nr:TonB-dependent receptor [Novosphingobium sp.]
MRLHGHDLRHGGLGALLAAAIILCAAPAQAALDPQHPTVPRRIDLPAQPLAGALIELSRRTGVLILADPRLLQGLHSTPVRGAAGVAQALAQLLRGTGLQAEARAEGGYAIVRLATMPAVTAERSPTRTRPARAPRPAAPLPFPPDDPDIVVTARLKEETSASVPIALSRIDRAMLQRRGVTSLAGLARILPGLELKDSASNKDRSLLLRGLGTVSTSPGVEPSVSTVVDGVVMSRSGQAIVELDDIERIEILRGPQGTLFGKNASAGVVNILTRRPTPSPEGSLAGAVSSDGEWRLSGRLAGPLAGGQLRGSLSAMSRRFDGNQRNLANGNRINGSERDALRAQIETGDPDRVKVGLAIDFQHTREDVPNGTFLSDSRTRPGDGVLVANPLLGAILAVGGVTPSPRNTAVRTTIDSAVTDRNYGGVLRTDAMLGEGIRLASITAYRRWDNNQVQDYDGTDRMTVPGAAGALIEGADRGDLQTRQFSQELRIYGDRAALDYVAGLYLLDVTTREEYQRVIRTAGAAGPATYTGLARYAVGTTNLAGFGELRWTAGPWRILAGGRLLYDRLSFSHRRVTDVPAEGVGGIRPDFAASGATRQLGWTGRAGVQLDRGPALNLYATVSRGYKGPAYSVSFNMVEAATAALDPETSLALELGAKGELPGGDLTYSLAAFSTRYWGFQANLPVSFLGIISTRLINAGSVRNQGLEADVSFRPGGGWAITANGALLDSRIIHFTCPAGVTCAGSDGGRMPFSPRWRASAEAIWTYPLAGGEIELGGALGYRSLTTFQFDDRDLTVQPGLLLVDAFASFRPRRGPQLRLSARNLFNRPYSSYIANGNVAGTIRFVPRDMNRFITLDATLRF